MRERLAEDLAVVERYERKRGRAPLPERFQNVLTSPEYGSPVPRSGPENAAVLRDYIDGRLAWFRAIEEHLVPGGELDEDEFFTMLVYAGHFPKHPAYMRAWSIINYMDLG